VAGTRRSHANDGSPTLQNQSGRAEQHLDPPTACSPLATAVGLVGSTRLDRTQLNTEFHSVLGEIGPRANVLRPSSSSGLLGVSSSNTAVATAPVAATIAPLTHGWPSASSRLSRSSTSHHVPARPATAVSTIAASGGSTTRHGRQVHGRPLENRCSVRHQLANPADRLEQGRREPHLSTRTSRKVGDRSAQRP